MATQIANSRLIQQSRIELKIWMLRVMLVKMEDPQIYLKHLMESLARGGADGEEQGEYATSMRQVAIELQSVRESFDEIIPIKLEFARLIIFSYRKSKDWDAKVARQIWSSWLEDAPEVEGSRTLRKLGSLMRSARAAQVVANSDDTNLIFQQTLEIHRAFNEFINSLLPFLINALQVASGVKPSKKTFAIPYTKKLRLFHEAAKPFSSEPSMDLFRRILRTPFRNAIAHSDVELRRDLNIVRFRDSSTGVETDMDIFEYVGLASLYTHLIQAYLGALTILMTYESKNQEEIKYIPKDFKILLYGLNFFN